MNIRPDDCVSFQSNNRVKLSLHFDGFIQFSGKNSAKITSGVDRETNTPKGLGVVGNGPFYTTTGPVVSTTIWGLDDYDLLGDKQRFDLFTPNDFYYRTLPHAEPTDEIRPDSFILDILMFDRAEFWDRVRNRDGRQTISLRLPFDTPIIFEHELRVIDLPDQEYFLGLMVSMCRHPDGFSMQSPSGYALSGPSLECGDPIENWTIAARFPRPAFIPDDIPSLDREPPQMA